MSLLLNLSVLLVGIFHVFFFYMEFVLWNKPQGLKIFKLTLEQANSSKVLAANQGVYNLLIGLLLILTLFISSSYSSVVQIFLLTFIFFVGLYGGYSVSKTIYIYQALPAFMTMFLLMINLSSPVINDISTSKILNITNVSKANEATYNVQKNYYSYIKPLIINLPILQSRELISKLIKSKKNWMLTATENDTFRIIATTQFFKFKDDIVLSLNAIDSNMTEVNMRSRSRLGKSDFGKNAKRIDHFFKLIQSEL